VNRLTGTVALLLSVALLPPSTRVALDQASGTGQQATSVRQQTTHKTAVPTIQASPNPVPAGPGEGSTTITWATGDDSEGQVQVAVNGGLEELFARGSRGTVVASWIDSTSLYDFRLYAPATQVLPKKLLASVAVNRSRDSSSTRPPPPTIQARIDPGPAGHPESVTITWSTGDGSSALVFVTTDGGPKTIFAQGPSGSESVNWLDGRKRYEFQLYADSIPQALLAAVKVPRRLPETGPAENEEVSADLRIRSFVIAIPNPVPAGIRSGVTEVSWGLGSGTGRVLQSIDGAPPTEFAAGAGGSTAAKDIHAGSTYQFLLYSNRAPGVLLASVTVTRERPYLLWLGGAALLLLTPIMLTRSFSSRRRRSSDAAALRR